MTVKTEHEHLKAIAMRNYSGHKDRSLVPDQVGDEQIIQFLPLVHKIASRIVTYLKPPLSFEDLVSAGTIGLVKAARDFDSSRQVEFTTYAYIRIKGAILDELRSSSLLPANVGKQIRNALELSRKTQEQTGVVPTDNELADKLGITVEQVYQLFENARAQHFVSIDGFIPDQAGDEQSSLRDVLVTAETETADKQLEKDELIDKLYEAIQKLDQRRRQIVLLYYQQQLTMKQIADLLEITESRVSQLHASALFYLSVELRQWKDGG